MSHLGLASLVFALTLALTYGAALLARAQAKPGAEEDLAGRSLNRWLIGLSAGTTGNSGFIVTGAVGLGYAGGVHWLLLPLGWLVGDLVYWSVFPARLNRLARASGAVTVSELLAHGLSGRAAKLLSATVALVLIVFLGVYASAQWLAGEKFLSGVFQLSETTALVAFGLTIVAYSSLGGFRGSVYTDVVQAVIRLIGTGVALGAVIWFALRAPAAFARNIAAAGPDFLTLFADGAIVPALGFIAGFAGAAVGFGLGQPQIVSRYFAGASPEETQAARWIYIGFLQSTWIAMTVFGIVLRGVMPGVEDPETGLSVFFVANMGAVLTGIIFADVFATIASTANGILVAIAQTLRRDLLAGVFGVQREFSLVAMTVLTFFIGVATIAASFVLPGNVFTLALEAVSKIGAGLAGPMMIKLFGWRHSASSLLAAILAGIGAAYAWTWLGYAGAFNEAGIGIACSLLMNWAVAAVLGATAKVKSDASRS